MIDQPSPILIPQVNRSRDITRQAMRWFPEEEEGLKDMFVRYMAALPKSMMVSVLACHIFHHMLP